MLLPFIDEKRLRTAMAPELHTLTSAEVSRNTHGLPTITIGPFHPLRLQIENTHCEDEVISSPVGLATNSQEGTGVMERDCSGLRRLYCYWVCFRIERRDGW